MRLAQILGYKLDETGELPSLMSLVEAVHRCIVLTEDAVRNRQRLETAWEWLDAAKTREVTLSLQFTKLVTELKRIEKSTTEAVTELNSSLPFGLENRAAWVCLKSTRDMLRSTIGTVLDYVSEPVKAGMVGRSIAEKIRAELVCCNIFDTGLPPRASSSAASHTICYWAEAAARIAEDFDNEPGVRDTMAACIDLGVGLMDRGISGEPDIVAAVLAEVDRLRAALSQQENGDML